VIGSKLFKRLRSRRPEPPAPVSEWKPGTGRCTDGRPCERGLLTPGYVKPLYKWGPSAEVVRHARTLLGAEPQARVAFIPICFPGRERGTPWPDDPQVVTVSGVVIIAAVGAGLTTLPDGQWGQRTALAIARSELRRRGMSGTAGWAEVYLTDDVVVCEDQE
jgi:hypothetical protein